MISLDYAVPGAAAAEIFALFYLFNADVPLFEDTERADRAQLRFGLAMEDPVYSFGDGLEQPVPFCHILGPTSRAVRVRAKGPVRLFGAGITPTGWATITGTDASTFLNRVVDARELLGDLATEMAARIGKTRDIAEMAAMMESMVTGLVARPNQSEFAAQVDAWLADHPSPSIDDLIAATGLSRRQVERRCNMLYGAPPKLLARKYRALKAAVALAQRHPEADALVPPGFYDQSHFIREVKQFTGMTPKQLREHPLLVSQLSIAGQSALADRVGPLISRT